MPSGPGVIPDERIAESRPGFPPGVDTFLLTSLQEPESIVEQHRSARTSALQLVDRLPRGGHAALRSALPGVRLVQVIHVVDEDAIVEAEQVAGVVHAILLDSGNPTLETEELGGTGRRHDWAVSARIRERVDVPVFLAGGLNPDNAHRRSRPSARSPSTPARGCATLTSPSTATSSRALLRRSEGRVRRRGDGP